MSLSTILASAATRAQSTLAQLQGAPDSGKNFSYQGVAGSGVFGAAQVQETMRPGGGSTRRILIPLTVTRDQAFTFKAETSLVRTDLADNIIYQIVELNTHDPLVWGLALLKVGQ